MDDWWQQRMLADATNSSDLRYRMWAVNRQEDDAVKLYRKKGLIEVEHWQYGINMDGVSIGELDRANGSPKIGDKIARDPENPKDRWLIAKDYFAKHYEPA